MAWRFFLFSTFWDTESLVRCPFYVLHDLMEEKNEGGKYISIKFKVFLSENTLSFKIVG